MQVFEIRNIQHEESPRDALANIFFSELRILCNVLSYLSNMDGSHELTNQLYQEQFQNLSQVIETMKYELAEKHNDSRDNALQRILVSGALEKISPLEIFLQTKSLILNHEVIIASLSLLQEHVEGDIELSLSIGNWIQSHENMKGQLNTSLNN